MTRAESILKRVDELQPMRPKKPMGSRISKKPLKSMVTLPKKPRAITLAPTSKPKPLPGKTKPTNKLTYGGVY
jgi:hypothetical protein